MRQYGLIGFPLGHSFSQRYFAEKFQKEGIENCSYTNFPIEKIEKIEEVLQEHPDLQGFNVTIPYKQAIIPYLSKLSREAATIGAVNCVRLTPDGMIGYNTDAYGFQNSLNTLLNGAHPERALVLGTGGASRAVKFVLNEERIPFDTVSRRPQGADYTSEMLTDEIIKAHPLIVNCTPLGTFPKTDECPDLPYEAIGPSHFLFDLVYNPPLTEFLRRGQQRGASIRNGYEMLVGQAELAWKIWNDTHVDALQPCDK